MKLEEKNKVQKREKIEPEKSEPDKAPKEGDITEENK